MARPIDTYRRVNTSLEVSQYRAVRLLLEGALERISVAQLAQRQANPGLRGESVGRVIAIVSALQSSLDKSQGGELAQNLDNLYDYINRRLAGVAVGDALPRLAEVQGLLTQVRDAWVEIGPQVEPVGG